VPKVSIKRHISIPLNPAKGSGERYKLPQWIRAKPDHQMHFGTFRGKNEAFQRADFLHFKLLDFNMQKFQNMEHSNSRTLQGL